MTTPRRDNYSHTFKGNETTKRRTRQSVLVLIMLFGFLFFFRPFFSGIALSLATPVWRFEDFLANMIAPVTTPWADTIELTVQNNQLKISLTESQANLAAQNRLVKEYRTILGSFGDPETGTLQAGTMAHVLVRPPQAPFDELIVDKGSKSLVTVGDIAFGPGMIALGRVSEVYGASSKIVLFSSAGEPTTAFVEDTGVFDMEGKGGGNFTFQVPRDTDIPGGTPVFRDGRRLLIGEVGTTTRDTNDSYGLVYVRTPLNVGSLQWVLIQKDK